MSIVHHWSITIQPLNQISSINNFLICKGHSYRIWWYEWMQQPKHLMCLKLSISVATANTKRRSNMLCGGLNMKWIYSIHVPGWLQKWLNLITAPGSVSNEPGSVTWLATKYLKTVSWGNHTEKLTTWWPQNISFWPKINIPSSYLTIFMLICLENTLKLQFDSYVTAVKFLT